MNILVYNFALDSLELGSIRSRYNHSINTADHPASKQLPRRTPFVLCKRIDELVQKMLKQGVIQLSQSPWASPVMLVGKRDGSRQFCVDYR